jgi:hypothetical protein
MPLRIFVKRGAHRRFNRLQLDAERLQVSVEWDRRQGERRKAEGPAPDEKRKTDRRGEPPFTWDAAEFVVVDDRNGDE